MKMDSPKQSDADRLMGTKTSAKFVDYYAEASSDPKTVERFEGVRHLVVEAIGHDCYDNQSLAVADIGCGAGTQSLMWARDGHNVFGIDISEELIAIAKERASEESVDVTFRVGSATDLPLETEAMDVCLVPELLEHVSNWQNCLDECCRIIRPGGALFLSTTNWICPVQQEYSLPLYSWYPGPVKRICERAATSSHPHWVNYATFPAVNWFSYYQLKREMKEHGFKTLDRFDIYANGSASSVKRALAFFVSRLPPARLLAQTITPYSLVVAIKTCAEGS